MSLKRGYRAVDISKIDEISSTFLFSIAALTVSLKDCTAIESSGKLEDHQLAQTQWAECAVGRESFSSSTKIPYKKKYWQGTKFGGLANYHAIAKFKSRQYF